MTFTWRIRRLTHLLLKCTLKTLFFPELFKLCKKEQWNKLQPKAKFHSSTAFEGKMDYKIIGLKNVLHAHQGNSASRHGHAQKYYNIKISLKY